MKKKLYVLGVAALVAAMLALSGVAQSAMWVGAELGGNFPLNTNVKVDDGRNGVYWSGTAIQPSVIGGAIIGYDFVNTGFGGANYPSWMQYFSFATDITYNRLQINGGQTVGDNIELAPNLRVKGYEVAWTFLFMAHFGFLRDSEVPSGRINPYIGVGPAILWSGVETPGRGGRADSMNVALVVEPGIRWVVLPNVSIDTAMRYRYAVPSWDFGNNTKITANPFHQFAFLVRANYHF